MGLPPHLEHVDILDVRLVGSTIRFEVVGLLERRSTRTAGWHRPSRTRTSTPHAAAEPSLPVT